ncbi:type IV secretory system conjugative DNA transfer family protein [Gluconobacter cerinus]|uniref:type IV secretory system conjugative DNA transfer family protein n=1 Tax=Gluconobacter cerinus TaxID=38307 RepID=UPI001B8B2F7F|nr:type IV secretory system conjugative DNA transfer family protein [Gluconobacter cerinus]MBS0984265.1 type IV secretory system conjugative DNA transfer family protein [Gluconobacter cerinus]
MNRRQKIQNVAILIGFIFVVEAVAVIATASRLFLWWNKIEGVEPPLSLWCWIPYFQQYHAEPAIRSTLLICAGVPAALLSFFDVTLVWSFYRARSRRRLRAARPGQTPAAPERALSDSYGNADWLSLDSMKARFPGPSPEYGGIVIGEAYRVDKDDVAKTPFEPADPKTWGKGGKAPLLIDPCTTGSTHGAVFAGSGGFKTTAVVIPTLLNWTGSAVIFDPSCEIGQMVGRARREMGQEFVEIRPGRGMNVLGWIDTSDPEAEIFVTEIVHQLGGDSPGQAKEKSENDMFEERGRELMTCILTDLLWSDAPPEKKTLREFRQRLVTPEKEMKKYLQEIYGNTKSPLARQLSGSLMGVYAETFSGIYSHAVTATKWLGVKAYADMVSIGDCDPRELRNGKMTVCVQISERSLRSTPALGRVVIGSLLSAVYQANGNVRGRVLYMLDEVNFLGRLKALAEARDGGRKFKITMVLIWQSVGQVEGTWGVSGKKDWYTSTEWRIYAGVKDPDTQKEVSTACGTYTIITQNEGESTSTNSSANSGGRSTGRSRGISERSRELIRPEEMGTRMRVDEQIVLTGNLAPIRCGRAIYFRRPEMAELVDENQFRAKITEPAE